MSQYGTKALSLAAAGMPPLMLLPYLESLRNLQPGMPTFAGLNQSVSSPPFSGMHPGLTQMSPTFMASPTVSASANKSSPTAPVTSVVRHPFLFQSV